MNGIFGVMNHLDIAICEDGEDAARQGFIYKNPEYTAVSITKVVVVQKGTVGGNPTVDLVMEDADGKKYVVLLTGKLLKSIPC